MKLARTALVAALTLAIAPAFAQTYSQTVFFGDSLTDSGFYRPFLVQQNPQAAVLGRFTTNPGLVWAEYLADYYGTAATPAWGLTSTGIVNAGGTNYAAGGARITLQPGFPPSPPTSFAPSLSQQVTAYLARNGGRADPDALYTVWGGANDLFFNLNGLTTQAQFLAAAGQQVGLVATLQGAGARYILVPTIPDVGRTPFGLSQGAAASAGITALVSGYNQTLFGGLAQSGLRVIPLDTFNLLREITATPAPYGFINVTSPACGATSSLVCSSANYPAGAPDNYAFADGVHPSSAAHRILADYAVSILEAPRQIAVLPHSAVKVGRARADRVAAQVEGRPEAEGMRWWADTRVDSQRYGSGDDYDGFGPTLTVGVDWASGSLVYGGFGGYGMQKIDWGRSRGEFEQTDATLGGYLGWTGGAAWVNGQVSYSWLGYDVDRDVQLGNATRRHSGSPDGSNTSVAIGAGWEFEHGALKHGPVLGVVSQMIDVDGYDENSSESTALAFPDQTFDSLIGSVGWQVDYTLNEHLRPYARLTYDHEFEEDAEQAFAQLRSMPGTAAYAAPGIEYDRDFATLTFGARTELFGLDANVGTAVSVAQEGGNDATVFISLGGGF